MSLMQIVVISGIVGVLGFFAGVLAWGDYQTRHITSHIRSDQLRAKRAVLFHGAPLVLKRLYQSHHEDDPIIPGV